MWDPFCVETTSIRSFDGFFEYGMPNLVGEHSLFVFMESNKF